MSAASHQAKPPGRGFLPITLPFRDRDGRIAGVVGLGLDLVGLNRLFAARTMPEGASIGIADRDGTLLVRLPDASPRRPSRCARSIRWMLAAARAGYAGGHRARTGVDRIVGYVPPAAMVDGALLVSVGLSPQAAIAGVEAAHAARHPC